MMVEDGETKAVKLESHTGHTEAYRRTYKDESRRRLEEFNYMID
jgi:hypothetical protein